MNKTLALCMILKNEGQGLEKAILSIKDQVDEIVLLVDNSSNDDTLEIAKKYATTLKTFDWFDDFGGARNLCHKDVKSDWIIFLDGHEYLKSTTILKDILHDEVDSILCTVEMETGSTFMNPRIYKNGVQFKGRVHEIQDSKKTGLASGVVIQHARPQGQTAEAIKIRDDQRNEQVPRIMNQQVKDNKKDTRALFHLMLHRQSLKQYQSCLQIIKQWLKYGTDKQEKWFVLFNKALCHLALGNYLRALWACTEAEKIMPERWEIAKLRGIILFQKKNFYPAIFYLTESLKENKMQVFFKPWLKNNSEMLNLIAECYFHSDQYKNASSFFLQASEIETDQQKKEFYKARADILAQIG